MSHHDLASDEGLRAACLELSRPESWDESRSRWIPELSKVIAWVRAADETERAKYDFQHKLWEENWVAAPGQGTISVEQALRDADFRAWLAKRSVEALPISREARLLWLTDLYGNIQKRLRPFLTKKMPHLKIFRVLAALYPELFTTVADKGKLSILCKAMGVPRKLEPVERHLWVRERLDHVRGAAPTDPRSLADRMALAWMLYAKFVRAPDELVTEEASTVPGESRLIPLPAARRRRGLTSLRGGFPTVLSALEFIREGVPRPDLIAFLRSTLPGVKESTLGVVINVLQSELGVVRHDGDRYVLTDRGETVLESQDPDDLADWLLTHILGVDKAIVELRDRGPLPPQELAESIRTVNPGWTTVYAPNSIQNWLRTLGVIETSSDWKHQLTEEGKEWAARIHWKPEALPAEDDAAPLAGAAPAATQPVDPKVLLPPLSEIVPRVQAAGRFEPSTIAQLHAGLWAHPRRHFAILTGLSGSGKTLIAREYASAISSPSGPAQLFTLAVQPGWYDPGALLGYVNPLRGDSYVRTPGDVPEAVEIGK